MLPVLSLSKIPCGAFRHFFAVCCAHFVAVPDTMFHFLHAGNSTCIQTAPLPIKRILALWGPLLFFVVQIPHLQPDMYFASGICPDTKCFGLYFLLTQKTLRGFFDSLRHPKGMSLFCNERDAKRAAPGRNNHFPCRLFSMSACNSFSSSL